MTSRTMGQWSLPIDVAPVRGRSHPGFGVWKTKRPDEQPATSGVGNNSGQGPLPINFSDAFNSAARVVESASAEVNP